MLVEAVLLMLLWWQRRLWAMLLSRQRQMRERTSRSDRGGRKSCRGWWRRWAESSLVEEGGEPLS